MHNNLLLIKPESFRRIVLGEGEIIKWFNDSDSAWVHDGDVKKPHAELASGKCSNGYFNCSQILSFPNICEILALDLVFKNTLVRITDWVVSSSYAAIPFGYEVAKALKAQFGFTEKDPSDSKKQVWKRFVIPEEATVLQVEELITTSGTFREVRRAIKEGNPEPVNFLNVVYALIHRPPKLPIQYDGIEVKSLIEKEIWAVDPEDCPLCKAGSKRLKPKENWAELTGKA